MSAPVPDRELVNRIPIQWTMDAEIWVVRNVTDAQEPELDEDTLLKLARERIDDYSPSGDLNHDEGDTGERTTDYHYELTDCVINGDITPC